MTHEEAQKLIPDVSFVTFAGYRYKFAGLYQTGHLLEKSHLVIYDEPPTFHTDSVNIDSCTPAPAPVDVKVLEKINEAAVNYAKNIPDEIDRNLAEQRFFAGAKWALQTLPPSTKEDKQEGWISSVEFKDDALRVLKDFYDFGDEKGYGNSELSRIQSCISKIEALPVKFPSPPAAPDKTNK